MKYRAITIAVFLLLGAVTTVVVSWYFAWTVVQEDERFQAGYLRDRFSMTAAETPSWLVVESETRGARQWALVPVFDGGIYDFYIDHPRFQKDLVQPPPWMAMQTRPPTNAEVGYSNPGYATHCGQARGWPALAMYSVIKCTWVGYGRRGRSIARHGILVDQWIPSPHSTRADHVRVLPLGILWLGFTINTVFYAALLWVPSRGPFALRRWRQWGRRRRGCCVVCNYDLTGNTSGQCPECGEVVGGL